MAHSDSFAMATRPNFGPSSTSWADLEIQNPVQGTRGNKSAAIQLKGGAPVLWRLPSLVPAFEPSSFGGEADAVRLTATFRVPDAHLELFEGLEEWVVGYCVAASDRLFGKTMTEDAVRAMFNSPLKRHDRYGGNLRCKLITAGQNKTRFWTTENLPRGPPEVWRQCEMKTVVKIVGLWWVGREFGVMLQLADCQVAETSVASPF